MTAGLGPALCREYPRQKYPSCVFHTCTRLQDENDLEKAYFKRCLSGPIQYGCHEYQISSARRSIVGCLCPGVGVPWTINVWPPTKVISPWDSRWRGVTHKQFYHSDKTSMMAQMGFGKRLFYMYMCIIILPRWWVSCVWFLTPESILEKITSLI